MDILREAASAGKAQDACQLAVVALAWCCHSPGGAFSEAKSPEPCEAWPLDSSIAQPAVSYSPPCRARDPHRKLEGSSTAKMDGLCAGVEARAAVLGIDSIASGTYFGGQATGWPCFNWMVPAEEATQ